MSRTGKLGLVVVLLGASTAHGQSSVLIYGLLSDAIGYTSNQGGHSAVQLLQGIQQQPRWGLRGTEDIGNGWKSVFVLENGFLLSNGALGQGGREFGRQAYLGISSATLGTVTVGRQIGITDQTLIAFEAAGQFATIGTHIGDNDNIFATYRINNSMQYTSPTYRGVRLQTQYAFSNQAGGFSNNSAFGIGANYAVGALSAGVAYEDVRSPNTPDNSAGAVVGDYGFTSPFVKSLTGAGVDKQQSFGAGATYRSGKIALTGLYSHVQFNYTDASRLKLNNYEAVGTYFLTPTILLGLGYTYTDGDYGLSGRRPHWHQAEAGIDYFLSKRTDLFLVGIYQRAGGAATVAQIYSFSPASGQTQTTVGAGIRVKF